MTIRFATEAELSNWNERIIANSDGGTAFQGLEYTNLKTLGGWRPRFLMADTTAISVIEKSLFGLGNVWYIMKGPCVASSEELHALIQPLREFAQKQGVFTIKMEPEIPKSEAAQREISKFGLVKTTPIHPAISTIVVDIAPPLDDILKNLPQKGRHAINRARRDGVTVEAVPSTDENCQTMFNLLSDTAKGAGFGIRSAEYYKKYWQDFAAVDNGQLFFAYYEGQVVAGAYAFVFGQKSTYKDGASIRKRTAYGASHLLQWHVIEWAKARGSLTHDLCGAPPAARLKDPTHPHYGIGLFKTQFNKDVTEYVGAYDLPVVGWKYALWHRFLEKLIRKLHYKFKHESYY